MSNYIERRVLMHDKTTNPADKAGFHTRVALAA